MTIDFAGLRDALLSRLPELIPEYLPGGRLVGKEWWCASIHGGQGDSFKFNLSKGVGKDFASNEPGVDLIAIHARNRNESMGDAAKALGTRIGYGNGNGGHHHKPAPRKKKSEGSEHVAPPPGAPVPIMEHFQHGKPSAFWAYKSDIGSPMFYVARYDLPTGKQVIPWTYSPEKKGWVARAWKAPRPLYGLDDLARKPGKPVLIVEGEKTAEAARILCGDYYAVVTWQGGSKAVSKADFTPTHGRAVAIWPDADKPGVEAAADIARILSPHTKEIKIIRTIDAGLPEGWDAFDAVNSGWDWERFYTWAKPRIEIYTGEPPELPKPPPVQKTEKPKHVRRDPLTSSTTIIAQNVQVNQPVAGDDSDEAPRSIVALWEEYGVQATRAGKPIQNLDNVLRVLMARKDFNQSIWFDEFHMRRFTTFGGTAPRPWNQNDDRMVQLVLQRDLGFQNITAEAIKSAVWVFAMRDRRCEPKDWMNTLKWDGTARIETFFHRALGAEDNEYTRAISRNWWLTMVARVFSPGCKVDHMVILEGDQGGGKSTALDLIGGAWYVDCGEPVQNKDFYLTLRGRLVVEISELDAFIRSESTTVKSAVTRRTDVFRPPYGEDAEAFPRRCVFVGTTNEEAYLRDATGARRFWPVKTGAIDIGMVGAEREQCFAEAVTLFKEGATWFGVPEGALREQDMRRQSDEWEGKVREWLMMKNETTILDVAEDCLKIEAARLDMSLQFRIGRVLRAIGWRKRDVRHNEKVSKVWYPKVKIQQTLSFLDLPTREPGEEG